MNSTSERKSSRRSSILKPAKQRHPLQAVNTCSSSNESTPTSKLKRRVSFAEKKHVKEFCNSPEQGTVWDNTYEEHDLSNGKDIGSSTKTNHIIQNIPIEYQGEAIMPELTLVTKSPIPVYEDYTNQAVSTEFAKELFLRESETIPVYQDTDNINHNEMSELFLPNMGCIGANQSYKQNASNVTVYEQTDQNESLEFTEVISTGHNVLLSKSNVDKTKYFHDMSVEYTANVLPSKNPICNIEDNIEDVSMDLTKVVSARVCPNKEHIDHIQQEKTTIFQNKEMEFTAPVVCLLDSQSTNKLPLSTYTVLNDEQTTVFTDAPMQITEIVKPQSMIEYHSAKETNNKGGFDETQVYDNDAMEITTIVTEDAKVNVNLIVDQSDKVTLESTMNLERNTLGSQNMSMIMTEIVPSHIVNSNGQQYPLKEVGMDSNNTKNVSMELTTVVPRHFSSDNTERLKWLRPELQRDKTIVYEDMSMEITDAIQEPIDTNHQLLLNKENCTSEFFKSSSRRSRTRKRVPNESLRTEKLHEVSMEFTTAISNPMLDKENCFVHEPSRNKISRLNNMSINRANELSSANMESLLHKDSNETSDQLGETDTSNYTRNPLEHEIIDNREVNQSVSMEMTNAVQVVTSHDKQEESIKNVIANWARRSVHNETSTSALEKNNIEKACYLDKKKIATNPQLDNSTIFSAPNLSNNEHHQVSCTGLNEKSTNETLMIRTVLNDNEALRASESTDRLEKVNHADEDSLRNFTSFHSKTSEELESINPPSFLCTDDSMSRQMPIPNIVVTQEPTCAKSVMKNTNLEDNQRPLESYTTCNSSNRINSPFCGERQSLTPDYQEYNMVRDASPTITRMEITRCSNEFLINRRSLGISSFSISGVTEISGADLQQFHHLSCVDADSNKENTITDCTSLDLVKPTAEASVIDNEDAESLEEVKLQVTRADNSISDNEILKLLSASTYGNDNNVHVTDDSNHQLCEIETEECLGKSHSEKQTKSCNINGSINDQQIELDILDSNEEIITMETHTVIPEEKEISQSNDFIALDPFSSLLNDLKNHSKRDDIIWNIFHENPERNLIVIGFMSSTLLLVMKFDTDNVENNNLDLSEIKFVSRVADDEPNTLVHITHRLALETVNVEALMLLHKEHKDVVKILEHVSADVISAIDFMIELQKLNNLNIMDFTRDRVSFTCLSKRAEIVIKVTINIKPFNTIRPNDIDIECELGSVQVDDLKNLIKNVKKDHRFLRRYINDVKDYLHVMKEFSIYKETNIMDIEN